MLKTILRRGLSLFFAVSFLLSASVPAAAASASGAVTAPAGTTYGEAVINQIIASILSGSGMEFKSASGLLMVADDIRKKHEYYMDHPGELNASYLEQMESMRNLFGIADLTPGEIMVMWEDASVTMRLSADYWQAFYGDYVQENATANADGGFSLTNWFGASVTLEQEFNQSGLRPIITDANGNVYTFEHSAVTSVPSGPHTVYVSMLTTYRNGEIWYQGNHSEYVYSWSEIDLSMPFVVRKDANDGYITYSFGPFGGNGNTRIYPDYPIAIGFGVPIYFGGSVAAPAPDSLIKIPSLPKEHADGSITYAPDIPLTPEDALVKNPSGVADIPFDKIVDSVTGKDIIDTGTINPDIPDTPATGIWGWLQDLLKRILEAIQSISSSLINALSDLLVRLFVPSDTFWNNNFNQLKELFASKLDVQSYQLLFDALREIKPDELQNLTVTLYGQTMTIVDFGWYKGVKPTIDFWLRGLMFIGLLIYNINNVYRLVRSGDISRADKFGALFGGGKQI